jgi:hypothetical protein
MEKILSIVETSFERQEGSLPITPITGATAILPLLNHHSLQKMPVCKPLLQYEDTIYTGRICSSADRIRHSKWWSIHNKAMP